MTDPKYNGYQRGLASMVYNFFDKNAKGSGIAAFLANKSANEPKYQLANELHILENFNKEKFICHLETIFGVLI